MLSSQAEKDALNADEDMGRQVSDTSQVTTASARLKKRFQIQLVFGPFFRVKNEQLSIGGGGSNGSTTGSLSGNDGSTTTYSTTTRRARARGKRGGGAAQTKVPQAGAAVERSRWTSRDLSFSIFSSFFVSFCAKNRFEHHIIHEHI